MSRARVMNYSVECSNRNGLTCSVATSLAGDPVEVYPDACEACAAQANPMEINYVTACVAVSHCRLKGIDLPDDLIVAYSKATGRVLAKSTRKRSSVAESSGPGTQLKNMIPDFFESEGCGCSDYAKKMNNWGPDGCEERIDEIVARLVSESEKIGYGFGIVASVIPDSVRKSVARKLVKSAISKARRANNAR